MYLEYLCVWILLSGECLKPGTNVFKLSAKYWKSAQVTKPHRHKGEMEAYQANVTVSRLVKRQIHHQYDAALCQGQIYYIDADKVYLPITDNLHTKSEAAVPYTSWDSVWTCFA